MKKLDVSQMENLQGGKSFRQCMESGLGSMEGMLLLGAAGCAGPAGILGAFVGASAACAIIAN
ncbi:hypothetical protein SAMN05216324_10352 [Chryseobacterium limigenitum]|uniref:Uncharacterized protein n=2 Tax=Chryseobacterium limigenitum TaxID=1612149 RepID=A0A1K2IHR3_9FLAO|nr:hypothetical protein SAMN05216324_10352 [Chryseobacterium limigenitum]